jgi:hypothetical protein
MWYGKGQLPTASERAIRAARGSRLALGLALALACCVEPGVARASLTFKFDETGQGMISVANGAPFQTLNGTLAPDPSDPAHHLALTFNLGSVGVNVGAGTVLVYDNTAMTILGDAIRFTNAAGSLTGAADRMIYYSDTGDPVKADTGFPSTIFAGPNAKILETGAENTNSNGFQYVAPSGNVYNGLSDGVLVPEPPTIIPAAIGAVLGLGAYFRRRR